MAGVNVEVVELESDVVRFSAAVEWPPGVYGPRLIVQDCRPAIVFVHPPVMFRLQNVEFVPDSPDLDIIWVQVGNVLCAAFAKRHPPCDPGTRITVKFEYRGHRAFETKLRLSGIGVVGAL
jgi:hypothetical protein